MDLRDGQRPGSSGGRSGPADAGAGGRVLRSRMRPIDDEVSVDDPDIEGSDLVGAAVVEQILGGRVIEERED